MSETIVLLAHGSPDPRSSAATHDLAARVATAGGRRCVAAFLDHDEPTLATAVRAGESAVVVPLLLSSAYHERVDVPWALTSAQAEGRLVRRAPSLGVDPALLDAVAAQATTLAHSTGPLLLAAAGTSDAFARAQIEDAATALARRTGRQVRAGYATQAPVPLHEAITELEARTGERASIGTLVLFPGRITDTIAAAADGRAMTAPLAQSSALVDVVLRRAAQHLQESAAVDVC